MYCKAQYNRTQNRQNRYEQIRSAKMPPVTNNLMIRLDDESKAFIAKAAELRRISMSDYVRAVTIAQARREVLEAEQQITVLSPEEQLAFWNALNETPKLTKSQRELGAVMRGEE
jgi:uncharacterized protein (DUF1778 family)